MEPGAIERELEELETRIERLRALYEQYFMGIERIEPLIPRKDVERRISMLRREKLRNTALRFKFQMLTQRYNTMQQYWGRITREIENGTYRRDVRRAAMRFGDTEALTGLARKRARLYTSLAEKQAKEKRGALVEEELELGADDLLEEEDEIEEIAPPPPPAPRAAPPPPPAPRAAPPPPPAPRAAPPPPPAPRAAPPPPPPAPRAAPPPAPSAPRVAAPPPPAPSAPRVAAAPPSAPRVAPPPPASSTDTSGGAAKRRVAELAAQMKTKTSGANEGTRLSLDSLDLDFEMGPTPEPPKRSAPQPAPAPPPPKPKAPARRNSSRSMRAVKPNAEAPPPAPARAAPRAPAQAAPATGEPSEQRLQQIYSKYIETKRAANEPTAGVTYEKLVERLRAQTSKLRASYPSKSIDYDVVIKDGKAQLKPIVR